MAFQRALMINWCLCTRTVLVVTGACVFKASMKILSNNGYSSLSTESSLDFRSLLNLFSSIFFYSFFKSLFLGKPLKFEVLS